MLEKAGLKIKCNYLFFSNFCFVKCFILKGFCSCFKRFKMTFYLEGVCFLMNIVKFIPRSPQKKTIKKKKKHRKEGKSKNI